MNRLVQILVNNQREKLELSWTHYVRFMPSPSGALGNQGSMGTVGVTDFVGGSQGSQGSQGSVGPPGRCGLQGCWGAQCFQGVQGVIGMTGPSSFRYRDGKKYVLRPMIRTQMPDTLQFSIRFIDAKNIYEEFLAILMLVSPNKEGLVQITNIPPSPIPLERRLKEEFVPIMEQKKKDFEKRSAKANLLMEMAAELGVKFEDGWYIDDSDLFAMPECAYETFGPQRYTDAQIKIMCHKDSEIYKELDRANLLQAYCPVEYRRGDSYSVNGGPMNTQPMEEVVYE